MPLLAQSVAGSGRIGHGVRTCQGWFRRERAWINEQHLKLCRIPAPTFFEQKRAEWMAERFRSLHWESKLDRAGNVIAWLPGQRDSAAVAVTAHLDTVLAPRLPEEVKAGSDGRLTGPGVSDNGAGLAALLALAAVWSNAARPLEDTPLVAAPGSQRRRGRRRKPERDAISVPTGERGAAAGVSGAGRAQHRPYYLPGTGQQALRCEHYRSGRPQLERLWNRQSGACSEPCRHDVRGAGRGTGRLSRPVRFRGGDRRSCRSTSA